MKDNSKEPLIAKDGSCYISREFEHAIGYGWVLTQNIREGNSGKNSGMEELGKLHENVPREAGKSVADYLGG